eukprot:CAMPEP_0171456216 /NCGR_PEP_ID=MMETSP0945-20130129/2793_1 /TAXON_ID=109269 /ORGANISM="Vaucheria litorea, Strain CCMP2940" /LENGTH=463 /DNA_ID=CAMNT_0011981599 /DNA_START=157 /DNA_END=1549 /DNA_ORIENTATION=-
MKENYFGRTGDSERRIVIEGDEFILPKKYGKLKKVGKGSYGAVCSAFDASRNIDVAIKKVSAVSDNLTNARRTLREIRILRQMGKHENITTLIEAFRPYEDGPIYLVMELEDSDLHKLIYSNRLKESHHLVYMKQLLSAVSFLHNSEVIHRDLKPANLLVSKNHHLTLCDFGLAREYRSSMSNEEALSMSRHVVTRRYRPPELMLSPNKIYGLSVDMWSVGCIFAEMLGKKPIFPGKNFTHQLNLIFEVLGAPEKDEVSYITGKQASKFLKKIEKKKPKSLSKMYPNASNEAIDLLSKLIVFDPEKRLTARNALFHPYVNLTSESGKIRQRKIKLDFDYERSDQSVESLVQLVSEEVEIYRSASGGENNYGKNRHSLTQVSLNLEGNASEVTTTSTVDAALAAVASKTPEMTARRQSARGGGSWIGVFGVVWEAVRVQRKVSEGKDLQKQKDDEELERSAALE